MKTKETITEYSDSLRHDRLTSIVFPIFGLLIIFSAAVSVLAFNTIDKIINFPNILYSLIGISLVLIIFHYIIRFFSLEVFNDNNKAATTATEGSLRRHEYETLHYFRSSKFVGPLLSLFLDTIYATILMVLIASSSIIIDFTFDFLSTSSNSAFSEVFAKIAKITLFTVDISMYVLYVVYSSYNACIDMIRMRVKLMDKPAQENSINQIS